jgi:hypothetical protein
MTAFDALAGAEDWGGRAFLLFWLCGWALGEGVVITIIAWQLFGRELLIVTPQHLELRREMGRFARVARYDAALVHDVTAARVPSDEDEGPRKDFCLKVSMHERTLRVGQGWDEREAEYIASAVLSRIRPRGRWGDEERGVSYETNDHHAAPQASPRRRGAPGVVTSLIFPLFIAGALAFTLLRPDEAPPPTPPAPSAPEGLAGPPSARDFSNPREYASAVTLFSLTHGGAKVFGRPDCRDFATWTAWSCTMRAKLPGGPYAGRAVTYRCFPTWQGPADRSAVPIVICGPENPPRIPGVVPVTPASPHSSTAPPG